MTLNGWALDNKGVSSVEVVIDGTDVVPFTYGLARGDVCKAWPGYAGCATSGFSGRVDVSGLAPCAHMLEIQARDGDGNERVIAMRRIFVSP